MDHAKIPSTLFVLSERNGFVLLPKSELEQQLSITDAVLNAAFVMYDALDRIRLAEHGNGEVVKAAAIARQAQEEVNARFWPGAEREPR